MCISSVLTVITPWGKEGSVYSCFCFFLNHPHYSVEKVEAMRYEGTYYSHPAGT